MESSLLLVIMMLAAAVMGVVAFRFLQLPPILGYLAVGILIGPHSTRLVNDVEMLASLAEFGVVFLMFSIGLEFSFRQLVAMRRQVVGLGSAQVLSTMAIVVGFCMALSYAFTAINISWQAAIALGGVLAMSSTAIVVKMLTERMELETEHGRRVISILIFQDLAVVGLLILVPTLANNPGRIGAVIGIALIKALFIMSVILFFGQKLMSRWLGLVARRNSQELFMLNLLLIMLGAAWLTEHFGLSMELGAFMAGMLISETHFKHQVEADIRSYRDVLLGLYFITIGMLLNLRLVLVYWWAILLLVILLFVIKFVLVVLLVRLFGASTGISIRTGLALAQAGEFGFVLLNQLGGLNMLEAWIIQVLLASMVVSMLTAPFLISKSDRITLKFSPDDWMQRSIALTQLAVGTLGTKGHVVIVGFGRTGQNVARFLSDEKVAYHAIDTDIERVRIAEAAGEHVSFADATRRESLIAAGIHRASALVITFSNTPGTLTVLHTARELTPDIPVIARCHDEADFDILKAAGANEVIPEVVESSLVLASHACIIAGIPVRRVVRRSQAARMQRYASLREYFPGETDVTPVDEETYRRLHSVRIPEKTFAVGLSVHELELPHANVEITLVRRGNEKLKVSADVIIQADDVLVLRGTSEGISLLETQLLK